MNTILKIISLSFLLLFISCEKDSSGDNSSNYQTMEPLSYFPVYPGSHWEYMVNNNQLSIQYSVEEYQLDAYSHDINAFQSDSVYVPFYRGIPIWGYEAHTGPISHAGSYPLTRIVSETLSIGAHWIISSLSGTEVSRKIVDIDATLTISGTDYYPTIVVEEYYSQGPSEYIWIARRYFTKDIGLVKEELKDHNANTVQTKDLVSYFINK